MLASKTVSNLSWKVAALAIVVCLVLAVAVQAGNEVWKTKPFEQWTMADIKGILYDSPWVKKEMVPQEWVSKIGMEEAPAVAASQGGSAAPVYAPPANQAVAQQPMGTPAGQAVFVVGWTSSRTLQEALVRLAVLDGSVKESDASQYVKEIPDIQITVQGADMTPFGAISQTELMSKSWLRGKQSGVRVNPTKVDLQEDNGYLARVVFTFPRKTSDGKEVISPDEKAFQFAVKIKNLDLGTTFDARKMADLKGPDF
jgi:hypothetical protein